MAETIDSSVLDRTVAMAEQARAHYEEDYRKYKSKLEKLEGGNTMSEVEHKKDDKAPVTGVLGTILGSIGTAGVLGGNNGLGGILGGNSSQQLSDAKAEIAQLKSERYTDQAILTERDRHLGWAERLAANDARIEGLIDTVAKNEVRNVANLAAAKEFLLQQNIIDNQKAEIDMLKLKNELQAQISTVASAANQGIAANAGNIACLQNTVNRLVQPVIPSRNVCNLDNGCGCCNSSVQQ